MVFGQALAVFQAFSLAKLRNLRLLSQKLKFWESLICLEIEKRHEIKFLGIGPEKDYVHFLGSQCLHTVQRLYNTKDKKHNSEGNI
jgi:hypothetical protein